MKLSRTVLSAVVLGVSASLGACASGGAAAAGPATGAPAAMTSSPERVAEGQTVFASACAGCHGANAQGGRAPNLADATWVGVASKDDHAGIFRIIKEGVPGRMPAMGGRQLTDDQIHALTFYIQSL